MTLNRPVLDTTPVNEELQKFINFLKGEDQLSQTVNIPNALSQNINDKLRVLSPIRAISKVTYTSDDKLDVVLDNNNTSSGWVTNDLIQPDNKENVSKISIYLHQLYAKPKVAFSFLEDNASQVEIVLKEKISTQMAEAENKAFLYGDGINQPHGIMKYNFVNSTNYKNNNKEIECVIGGKPGKISDCYKLIELMEILPSKYLYNACWLMSRNVASQLRLMKDEGSGKFIWQNSVLPNTPDTLLGYPVIICDDLPKLNSKEKSYCPILFGNFYEAYQIVEKPNITLLKDPYIAKPFIEFYATKRVGGDIVNFDAIKALVLQQ